MDAVFIGPVRIPVQVCETFEVRDGQIVVWCDTFDWVSGLVNTVFAAPLYAFRKGGHDDGPEGRRALARLIALPSRANQE